MHRLYIIGFIFMLVGSQLFGQVNQKRAKSYSDIANRDLIEINIDSAQYYIDKDYKKSFIYIEKAFQLLGKKSAQKNQQAGKLYELLGDIYYSLNQYDLASEKYELAEEHYALFSKSLAVKQLALFFKVGEKAKAKSLLDKLEKKLSDKNDYLKLYQFKGEWLMMDFQLDAALVEFQKGLDLANELKQGSESLYFSNKVAEIYNRKGNKAKAEKQLNESFENAEELDVGSCLQQAETNAAFYRENDELDMEISIRQDKIKVLNTLDNDEVRQQDIQYQNLQIADAYIEKREYEEAIPYLKKSTEAIEKSVLDVEIQATKKLSEVYEKMGNYGLALENYRKYVDLTDELYQQKEKEIAEAVNLTKDLSDKQKRIDVLELESELHESREAVYQKDQSIALLSNRKQQLIIYSLIGGLLLSLIAIFFFYKSNQQRKTKNNILALRALKAQMNPHFIFNALNSVNHYIAMNDERTANKYITDFSKLMRKVLVVSEKDFISLQDELNMIELYVQLEHLRFEDQFDYELDIDKSIALDRVFIPPMLVQPFVENAVWHGLRYLETKGHLKISLRKKADVSVEISIIDDGVGRKKSQELKSKNQLKKESRGMKNTMNRIRIINETFNNNIKIDVSDLNGDGSGTRVSIVLPLDFELINKTI